MQVLAITTDNASNNDALMKCIKDKWAKRGIVFDEYRQHNRCMAHIINLAVQDALSELRVCPTNADEEEDGVDDEESMETDAEDGETNVDSDCMPDGWDQHTLPNAITKVNVGLAAVTICSITLKIAYLPITCIHLLATRCRSYYP